MTTPTANAPASRGRRATAASTAPALPSELEALLRRIRLPYLRVAAPDVLATARSQHWDPAEVLRVLITEEVIGRDAATRRMRRKTAKLPVRQDVRHLAAGRVVHPTHSAGAVHTGMDRPGGEPGHRRALRHRQVSHFVEALAHTAIEADLRVAWFTLETLAGAIGRAKADGSVARTVARICRVDLIVVDLCRTRNYAERAAGPRVRA